MNDELYIEHPVASNAFIWNEKMEDKKLREKAKSIFTSLKTDPNSILFSKENMSTRLLKKFKK